MAEGIGIPIILHGKENKFQMTLKLEELVCKEIQSAKNALQPSSIENVNSAMDESKNSLRKPCESINSFENYVGKLNEICSKRSICGPHYNVSVTENGEFIIQCTMFDNTVTRGRSKSRKDAKQEAAKAMLHELNEREEARRQTFSEVRECANKFSMPIVKVTDNEGFVNNVGKLNEIYFKLYQKRPSYRLLGTDNGEFVTECILFDNTVTRGRSKLSKKASKHKAAEAMLSVLSRSKESQNKKKETECSNHMEFLQPTKNLTENVIIRLSSPTQPFENHVETINKISSTSQQKQSLDFARGSENWDFIDGCEILDNTRKQSKFKIYTIEEMRNILNGNEKSQCQKPVEIIKEATNLTNSILNARENISVKTENSKHITECSMVEQPTFQRVEKPEAGKVLFGGLNNSKKWKYNSEELKKIREELMNGGEKPAYQKDKQLINPKKNVSIRLSSPTEPSNEIHYQSKQKYLPKRVCGTDSSGECKIFENTVIRNQPTFKQDVKPKAFEAMNDSEKWKIDRNASRYHTDTQVLPYAKNISNSSLNETENEKFKLSSEQFERHTETRKESYYKNNKKHLSHRVCYSEESRYQKDVKFMTQSKTLTNSANVSVELSSPVKQFGNRTGKLNKTCFKSKNHCLGRGYGIENVEFTTESNIFESIVTQEQPKIKKNMEQNAPEVLLDLLNDSEASMKHKEESIRREHMEFYKCAETSTISSLNVRKKGRFPVNSRGATFHNHVKALNEKYGKRYNQDPCYRGGKTEKREFITECIMNNTITQGQSRSKNEGKQKSAEEMVQIHSGSGKMMIQQSMDLVEKYKTSKGCPKPLVGLDTDIEVERNHVPSQPPNKSTILVSNNLSDNTSSLQIENYVGKLNEICLIETHKYPSYTTFQLDNGEFATKCETFNKTCTYGYSTTKKVAKQEAAKAMILMISKNTGKYQHQRDGKSSQAQKFSESLSNVAEKKIVCSNADIPSSSMDENDNLLESSNVFFESHVGKLIEICIREAWEAPEYIEYLSEDNKFTCVCKVINNTGETVTWGQSMLRKDAQQKAAQAMIEILNRILKFEGQNLMKSVSIIDTTYHNQQKPIDELNIQMVANQSDWSSVEYMNEQELKMELNDLNVSYTITAVKEFSNVLSLKTKQTEDYKSLTFISTGENRRKICLNLLRQAVFGLRILKK